MVSILKHVKFGMLTHLQSHTAQQATNVASGIYYKHKKREINAYEQRLPPARLLSCAAYTVSVMPQLYAGMIMNGLCGLLTLLHLSLELCESVKVAKSSRCSDILDYRSLLTLLAWCTWSALLWLLSSLLECTRVAEDDALSLLDELDYLELELLASLGCCAVLLLEMLWSSESLTSLVESDDSALIHHLCYLACMYRAWSVYLLVSIPWVLLKLLVSE